MPKIRPTPTPSRTMGVGADLIRGLACISERPAVREPTTPGTEKEDIDCRNFCAATLIHIIGHLVMDVEGMMSGHEREVPMRIISDYPTAYDKRITDHS